MSRKILLVYDDYSEMIRMQTDLMKIGFDVVGIVNEALLLDQLLIFNPELVISAGKGGKVSAPSVAQKLKEHTKFVGKVMLLLPSSQRPGVQELSKLRMDVLLELPSPFHKVVQAMSRLLGLDASALIEKYRKARLAEGATPEELSFLKESPRDRASRFERAMKGVEIDPRNTTFDRQTIKATQENLKKSWDFKVLKEIDELKKRFAQALFKK